MTGHRHRSPTHRGRAAAATNLSSSDTVGDPDGRLTSRALDSVR